MWLTTFFENEVCLNYGLKIYLNKYDSIIIINIVCETSYKSISVFFEICVKRINLNQFEYNDIRLGLNQKIEKKTKVKIRQGHCRPQSKGKETSAPQDHVLHQLHQEYPKTCIPETPK